MASQTNKKQTKAKKPKKKMNPVLKFFGIVFGIVFTFLIVAGVSAMVYVSNKMVDQSGRTAPATFVDANKPEAVHEAPTVSISKVPEQTTFAIFGVDEDEIRTDVMIVGSFNSKTRKIGLISVPRDIMVSIPDDVTRALNDNYIYPPRFMKMNEVLAYVGEEYGMWAVMEQLEHELGVKLDYYAKMNTAGFRKIVDALGGVDMTLERDYQYYDPDQDLRIDLKAGPQHLDGKNAEGLVRYREDYQNGDLQRIEVQQKFMDELFRQALNRDNLVKNAPQVLSTLLDCVTTDISLTQASRYLQFIPSISPNNIDMYALTGYNFRAEDGKAYLKLDTEHKDECVDLVFFGGNDDPPEDSKELRLAVLNGSGVTGLARKTSESLTEAGYTVDQIGDFGGQRVEQDRIFVKKEGFGKDLQALFPGSEIVVDKKIVVEDTDITIVMGTHNIAAPTE